ncbi:MAG: glucose-6-phosphate isomerase [Phascolarctobacterium sp.]|nr:glucose-6-phosphate isomerase [Phascolarctobacterium sp.]
MKTRFELPSGFIFDFTNMFGANRLEASEVETALKGIGASASEGVKKIAETGFSKAHLSKDGAPEHVFFPRMPYVQEGNPNTPESIAKLKEFSAFSRKMDAVIFLGVGGSYLGNKVLADALGGFFWNSDDARRNGQPRIYFCGNNVDSVDAAEIVHEVERLSEKASDKLNVLLVPISKSGTTLETMTAFLYFYSSLAEVSSINLNCSVCTDLLANEENSPLLKLAHENGWFAFDVKEGIGGRFSVMTDVGLVTMAALGGDIDAFLTGARDMNEYVKAAAPEENPALINALTKFLAYGKGRDIEVFMPYSMHLKSLSEWYIQLLAESLGKKFDREGNVVNYGRTPIVAVGTTDMHAQTQQHQEGKLNKVVQFLEVAEPRELAIAKNAFPHIAFFKKYDGLSMHKALKAALDANEAALTSDNRYNARFIMPKINEYFLGQIMFFLMLSVAYEGELADVDAYDQPGVEIYKAFMKSKL